jgi:L-threonine kinase
MASSTADIVAGLRALAAAFRVPLSPLEIAEITTSIEPSDGIMFPELCAISRMTGRPLQRFPWWPTFPIAMTVPKESRVTPQYHVDDNNLLNTACDEMLDRLARASHAKDPDPFAEIATLAANQQLSRSKHRGFENFYHHCRKLGAIGRDAAHTGTVVGVLFPDDANGSAAARDAIERFKNVLDAGSQLIKTRIVSPAEMRQWNTCRIDALRDDQRSGEMTRRNTGSP